MQAKCLNVFSQFNKLFETDVFMLLLYYYLYNVKVLNYHLNTVYSENPY